MADVLNQLICYVEQEEGIFLWAGADSRTSCLEGSREAYRRAQKALMCSMRLEQSITFYDQLHVDLFIHELAPGSKQEFAQRIFGNHSKADIDSWVRVLKALFANDGSITRTAEQLYIHKNTLQYQLNKIQRETGYDLRNLEQSSLFYIAIQFYEYI